MVKGQQLSRNNSSLKIRCRFQRSRKKNQKRLNSFGYIHIQYIYCIFTFISSRKGRGQNLSTSFDWFITHTWGESLGYVFQLDSLRRTLFFYLCNGWIIRIDCDWRTSIKRPIGWLIIDDWKWWSNEISEANQITVYFMKTW
jgi:hypothetical protein